MSTYAGTLFSGTAKASGILGKSEAELAQMQMQEQYLNGQAIKTGGIATDDSKAMTKQAYLDESNATQCGAISSITGGGTQFSSELAADASERIANRNPEIEKNDIAVKHFNDWEDKLKNNEKGIVKLTQAQNKPMTDKDAYENIEKAIADPKNATPDLKALMMAKRTPKGQELLANLKKEVRFKKKDAQKNIDNIKQGGQRIGDKFRGYGRGISDLGRGTAQMFQAAAQADEANAKSQQIVADNVVKSVQSIGQSYSEAIRGFGDAEKGNNQLLEAMARLSQAG